MRRAPRLVPTTDAKLISETLTDSRKRSRLSKAMGADPMSRTELPRVVCFILLVVLIILVTLALGRYEAPQHPDQQLPTLTVDRAVSTTGSEL